MKKQEYLDYVSHFKTLDVASAVHVEILDIVLKKFYSLTDTDKLYILLNYSEPESKSCEVNDKINEEVEDIEKENMIEMIHLRAWVIKMAITVFVVVLLGVLLPNIIGGSTSATGTFKDWFNHIREIYNLLFK